MSSRLPDNAFFPAELKLLFFFREGSRSVNAVYDHLISVPLRLRRDCQCGSGQAFFVISTPFRFLPNIAKLSSVGFIHVFVLFDVR
jgi:hypothetical protein